VIHVEGVTKYYTRKTASSSRPAIDNISFDVNDGEIVGFVGLNGAGKTTTIRIASGVALPSSGTITVDGRDIVKEKAEASKRLGWVPEFPNFDQNAKAKNLLLYFAGFHGIEKNEAEKRADELFQRVSLTGSEGKKLRTYSQGMKKRFSLAAALLPDPKNFLFDEILNGLDPEGIHFMRSLVVDLKKKEKAVLLSSHILSEIENIADRVVFIHKGKIIKIATREELAGIGSAGGVLKIVFQNLNDAALGYLKGLGEVKLEGSDTVFLSAFSVDPTLINTELVKRGFLIREFSFEKSSLEDYFFKLVGVTPEDSTRVVAK